MLRWVPFWHFRVGNFRAFFFIHKQQKSMATCILSVFQPSRKTKSGKEYEWENPLGHILRIRADHTETSTWMWYVSFLCGGKYTNTAYTAMKTTDSTGLGAFSCQQQANVGGRTDLPKNPNGELRAKIGHCSPGSHIFERALPRAPLLCVFFTHLFLAFVFMDDENIYLDFLVFFHSNSCVE